MRDLKTKPAAPKPIPKYFRGWSVGWRPAHYVHGDGVRASTAYHSYQVVPFVADGRIRNWALIVDDIRSGWPRFESIERAQAEAELMILMEA